MSFPPSIPVLDLSADDAISISKLSVGFRSLGCCALKPSGIPADIFDELLQQHMRYFEQPMAKKMEDAATVASNMRGYTPPQEETLAGKSTEEHVGDSHEGYYIGREVAPSSPECKLFLTGPNVWPSNLTGWRESMEVYVHKAMLPLCQQLLRLIEKSIQCDLQAFFDPPTYVLRLLRYGVQQDGVDAGHIGASAHTDYGAFTVLWHDGTQGMNLLSMPY
eukprot:GHVT01068360.1.p1 GENE.GHVT01068360.1~~GHVT01068360.1.p1  ORF type:complete len:220 (+),score=26.62 GHVT01068360.1:296-955(+)